ncbi:MAG: dihydrolipoyl dehydrogenase [Fidelibacterota bacterium]
MKFNYKKRFIFLALILFIAAYFTFDLNAVFNLEFLKDRQVEFRVFYIQHRLLTILIFSTVYILMAMLSLPGATIMTLAGGTIFGFILGVIVVSVASTLGATLAFFNCRYLFRNTIQERYKNKLEVINRGVERDGALYLLMLRLSPAFPFFFINAAFAKTYLKMFTYAWVSQLGMLPGTIVLINAGTQLSRLESLSGILSPGILISFALLGVFPILSKKVVNMLKNRRNRKKFKKPQHCDYNVIVLGAGSGGLVVAYIASAVKARVALLEKNKMGGDCLNTGCVPSKAFIRSAKMLHYATRAKEWGFESTQVNFDFAQVMERVQIVIKTIEPHDSEERYRSLGVEVYTGEAKILDPYRVEIQGQVLTTRNIVVATGAGPLVPPVPGLESVQPLTSDTIWNLRKLPPHLVVVGGGPIGCELAQAFARFGSRVTLLEGMNRLLLKEDPEVSALVKNQFEKEGITVLTGHMVEAFENQEGQKTVTCDCEGEKIKINGDEILIALGRKANVNGFGLEKLGVEIRPNGTIEVDAFLRTNYPNIYAVGDVTGPYQFTHAAGHQAWYASVNSLFSPLKKFKVDYRVLPWTTFTDPEVARVGLNETEAREQGISHEVITYDLAELDRAITDGENQGFIRILVPPGKDKILGVTMVAAHAGDMLTEFVMAMKHGIGLNKILGLIHSYPTFGEANKLAAGVWKKKHAPATALKWLEKFHGWRRKSPPAHGNQTAVQGAEAD